MNNTSIYKDIALRTKGDIYLGVVGPVRTGKSTFIKRFMNQLVLPKINAEFERERATDELPQSSSGRTIMTTEPKFVPENAVKINVDENSNFNVRLIDCVGYIVPSALGYIEEDKPRMVMTPWFEEPVPFNMAAEIGTKKVITEHSTIGLVITTDGSISDIPRSEYAEAEERVINELVAIEKPFAVLLNCTYPNSEEAQNLAAELKDKYKVPVIAVNCLELNDNVIRSILGEILYEFPIKEIFLDYPKWVNGLENGHHLKNSIFNCIKNGITSVKKIREISDFLLSFKENENVDFIGIDDIDLGKGKI
ncbi:MAG: stage IV sporulation protein A, partial [Clostridia bacterium]|nr:stage IV sporulation protein A [Clostridia bacterium]